MKNSTNLITLGLFALALSFTFVSAIAENRAQNMNNGIERIEIGDVTEFNLNQNPVCGNNICEEDEANIPGGCGPNADPRCLGPPSRNGTCPQDCEKNKSLQLSNGRNAEIKIMPDAASEKAIERLGELNFTIELKEVGQDENVKAVYEIKGEKQGRFLGIFKIIAKVQAQVDAETGEVVKIKRPWWAFLASGI